MFRISKIFILILLIANTQAISASHLMPEEGLYGFRMFNPYYEAVGNRLIPKDNFRICQIIVLPSFSAEYAVYIKYDKEKSDLPKVVSLKFEKQLWTEMNLFLDSSGDKKKRNITDPEAQRFALSKIRSNVKRAEATIDSNLVDLLESVWINMLTQVRYPEKPIIGLDGIKYHFATLIEGVGYRTGKAWSPSEGTTVYDLVEIAEALSKYPNVSEKDRKQISQNLRKMAENLIVRLKNNK